MNVKNIIYYLLLLEEIVLVLFLTYFLLFDIKNNFTLEITVLTRGIKMLTLFSINSYLLYGLKSWKYK